jgi:hypothetical protein
VAGYWVDEQAGTPPEISWEPVMGFAIQRGPNETEAHEADDDEVIALIHYDGCSIVRAGDPLYEADNGGTFGLFPARVQDDPSFVAALRKQAESDWGQKCARQQREQARDDAERPAVQAFVQAQPDSALFARRMRQAGCRSLHHAWLAITLAQGDHLAAIRHAAEPPWQLEKRYAARAKTGS